MFEGLIMSVESSAQWRAEKAEQYPDDSRNARSSHALKKLAEKMHALPADDEYVLAYEAVMARMDDDDLYRVSEHESQFIGRYGFDYPQDGDPSDFLGALTEYCQELIDEAEERTAEEERDHAYEEAKGAAGEEAQEAAHKVAKVAADETAKKAADAAYKEAYAKAYKETYDEAYRAALIEALNNAA